MKNLKKDPELDERGQLHRRTPETHLLSGQRPFERQGRQRRAQNCMGDVDLLLRQLGTAMAVDQSWQWVSARKSCSGIQTN